MESGDGQTHQNQSKHDPHYDRSPGEWSHYDLGGRRLDRSLADALSLRRQRSDHVALAGVTAAWAGRRITPGWGERDRSAPTPNPSPPRAARVGGRGIVCRTG